MKKLNFKNEKKKSLQNKPNAQSAETDGNNSGRHDHE